MLSLGGPGPQDLEGMAVRGVLSSAPGTSWAQGWVLFISVSTELGAEKALDTCSQINKRRVRGMTSPKGRAGSPRACLTESMHSPGPVTSHAWGSSSVATPLGTDSE